MTGYESLEAAIDHLNGADEPDLLGALLVVARHVPDLAPLADRVAALEAREVARTHRPPAPLNFVTVTILDGPPAEGDSTAAGEPPGPDDGFAAQLARAERSAWDLADRFVDGDDRARLAYQLAFDLDRLVELYRGALTIRRAAAKGGGS